MPDTPPSFDASAVAADLAVDLHTHLSTYGRKLAEPSRDPMFTQHADGTILDRAGHVLVHGQKA